MKILFFSVIVFFVGIAPAEKAADDFFTLVVLPDTQNYCDANRGPAENFYAQMRWIKEKKDELNIVMVAHLGDIVNNPQTRGEWVVADKAFRIIDGQVPYILNLGNHDIGSNGNCGDTRDTLVNEYFPVKRFTANSIYDKHFGKDKGKHFFPAGRCDNYYLLLEDGGAKFIIISLEFKPRDEALEWANKIVKQHSDRHCIVITHGYLDSGGVFTGLDRYLVPGNNCEKMWDKFLKKHSNIFMLLCGHEFGEATVTDKGDSGNVMYQLLADYQHWENGGDGFLRIMKFFPSKDKIEVSTYSPVLKKEIPGETSKFTLEYKMSTATAK